MRTCFDYIRYRKLVAFRRSRDAILAHSNRGRKRYLINRYLVVREIRWYDSGINDSSTCWITFPGGYEIILTRSVWDNPERHKCIEDAAAVAVYRWLIKEMGIGVK